MATHDYVIANGTGAAVRSDLNNALAAIVSNNSSSSEPGTTYAYQWWADTNANVLKIRNSSNDGWITLRELDGTMLIEDGSASTPGLAFADDVNTGIFSGGADEIALATGGAERLKISTSEAVFNDASNDIDFRVESNGNTHMLYVDAGNDVVGIGTSSVISDAVLTLSSASDTALFFQRSSSTLQDGAIRFEGGAFQFLNGANSSTVAGLTEAMRIDSSARLLVGASSAIFDNTNAKVQIAADQGGTLAIGRSDTSVTSGNGIGLIRFYGNDDSGYQECARIAANADGTHANDDKPTRLEFLTTADGESSPTEQIRIKSNGHIIFKQQASSSPYPEQQLKWSNDDSTSNGFFISQDSDRNGKIFHEQGLDILFGTSNTERMRLDSSGLLQIGTSAGTGNLNVAGGGDAALDLIADIDNNGSNQWPIINFRRNSATGTPAARIYQQESSGSLVFDNDGAERMRMHSTGHITIGKTSTALADEGVILRDTGEVFFTAAGTVVYINRTDSDGNLVYFYHDNNIEGSISVSGSTVSYNGGHLTRWSQLAGGAERTEILRGSVLSNLDEMCEWGEEDNEQLNRMKISDVEGDPNVAGVFQGWDDDDDTYTNDFYCAMTGDFVIRIAQGTTVARGDLLMSAGDGTAKPQDDDIVRSKTIAKVTSTTVSTTYSDGSYCVPCVLMAC